jgi:hypothetical protein
LPLLSLFQQSAGIVMDAAQSASVIAGVLDGDDDDTHGLLHFCGRIDYGLSTLIGHSD